MGGKWYAVARGRRSGIFTSWPECQKQVQGFSAPIFKSFKSQAEAEAFLALHGAGDTAGDKAAPKDASGSGGSSGGAAGASKRKPGGGSPEPAGAKRAAHSVADRPVASGTDYLMRFDGGARGNPGEAGAGAVIWDPHGSKVWHAWWWLGTQTNNFAEATGLERGLEQARALGISRLRVEGDSNLLINQLNGVYQVKNPALKIIHGRCRKLVEGMAAVSFTHIYREGNGDADRLANTAMDTRADGEEYFAEGQLCAKN
eukprot:jgi/Tetstr1/444799/TSEL_032647.t1